MDCQRFDYDISKGERLKIEHKYHKILRYTPKRRPISQCGDCPKKSPENAARLKLTAENKEVLDLFLECRAMNWQATPPAVAECRVLRNLFGKLESIFAAYDRQQNATMIASVMANAMAGRQ